MTAAPGVTDGAVIALGVGVAFSTARELIAGDLIGTVVCFSNSRATLLSFPRSRTAVGEPGVAVLMAVGVGCGSPTAPRFEGEVAGGKLAAARGASVDSGDAVDEDVGVVIGVAITRGVKVRCEIGVDVSAARAGDVDAGVGVTVGVAVVTAAGFVSCARTNFFGGASRGGVASDLIFARACSASRWLLIAAQPKSIVA